MKLSELVEYSGKLLSVTEFSFSELPDQIALIVLKFEALDCSIQVVEDSDEILLSNKTDTDGFVENPPSPFWRHAICNRLLWVWVMENNQGYSDGLQFEFMEGGLILQVIVTASSIRRYTVVEYK